MNCEDVGEFASRLCDGQVIPREVAAHMGTCEVCRTRLNTYTAIGVELRRAASLEQPVSLQGVPWERGKRIRRRWWQEGRTTMRIPRFAFVSMLVLILILSGGLVLVRARATAWGRPDEALEPRKDEFRVVAPVLIRGKEVICNLSANGHSIDDGDPDAALMIYYPGEGRYLISRVPFEGAVEGTVRDGQIKFTLHGLEYLLLSAAPILSAEHVWISHDPKYKLSEHMEGASDDRPWFRVRSLRTLLQPQLGNVD